MSQKKSYSIRCPKCGREQQAELWCAVNAATDPALKEDLLANRLNVVTCENCSAAFRVDLPFVYSDPAHRTFIYWMPLPEKDREKGEEDFQNVLRELGQTLPSDMPSFVVSLVFDRYQLVERIFLHEANLNERIIEYIKYLIYLRNRSKVAPESKILLFDAQDSNDKVLCFVVQDAVTRKLESLLQYDRKTYDALREMFDRDDQTPSLMELFPGPHISARAMFLRGEAPSIPPVRERPPPSPN
jgi:hypothetical protein